MAHVPARQIIVDLEHDGRRIDNFLAWTLKGIPRDRIYRMLRSGEVRVNGGRIRQDYRLTTGEVLRLPPVRMTPDEGITPPESLRAVVRDSVLYEDEALLVLNKPARIAVHGGVGIRYGLIEVLRDLKARCALYRARASARSRHFGVSDDRETAAIPAGDARPYSVRRDCEDLPWSGQW